MTNKHRLPSHTVPKRYQIMLKPDLDSFVFAGEETILVDYVIPRVLCAVAVGTALTYCLPHRTRHAGLPHWAPTSVYGIKAL